MDIQSILAGILTLINNAIIPFILAIAFLIFLWNIARYFIIGGANSEDQEMAKSHAIWGITAFVVIVSVWGIVNFLVSGFGFGGVNSITPDYMCKKVGGVCVDKTNTPAPTTNQVYPGVPSGFNIPGNESTGSDCLPPLIFANGVCSNAPPVCSFPYYIKDGKCTGP